MQQKNNEAIIESVYKKLIYNIQHLSRLLVPKLI